MSFVKHPEEIFQRSVKTRVLAVACLLSGIFLPIAYWRLHSVFSPLKKDTPKRVSGEWTLPVPIYPGILEPQHVLRGTEKALLSLTYSRLIKVDGQLNIEPDALQSWTYDVDSRTFRFRLKSGMKFQDRSSVSSDDVIFSFHRWAQKRSLDSDLLLPIKGVREYQLGEHPFISGIHKIDALTFEITLNYWTDNFIRNLSTPRFVIFPNNFRGQSQTEFFKHPIGSGPYRLTSSGQGFGNYDRFDDYYFGKPITRRIRVVQMTKSEAQRAYQEGRINNLLFYYVSNPREFIGINNIVRTAASTRTFLLIISPGNPALRSYALRQDIARQINKRNLVAACYPGAVIASSIIPPGLIGTSLEPREIDRALTAFNPARQNHPALPFYIENRPSSDCMSRILSGMLVRSNIHIERTSFNRMYHLLQRNDLPLWVEDFSFKNADPISVLQYFNHSSNEYLLGKPIPALQKIFTALEGELSPLERARNYAKIDRYLTKNYLAVPLFYPRNIMVYKKSVKGIDFLRVTKYAAEWQKVYVEE